MFKQVLEFNKTDRAWHLPIIAGICVGAPLLIGYLTNNIDAGKLASIGALVILHIQSNNIVHRMMALMICGFGFILSFTIGIIFSFSGWLVPVILGIYAFYVHYSLHRLKLSRPPGNFFFVMIASIAISNLHKPASVTSSIGNFSLGVMLACVIGLLYSLVVLRGVKTPDALALQKDEYVNMTESIIFGTMTGVALLVAFILKLENPYWVPTSCMAVMQGVSTKHVWTRAGQRIFGTFIGLGLTWLILQTNITTLQICICILLLQILIEFLVVRNYGIAAIFITTLTILLAEPNASLVVNTNHLMQARFFDILIGSIIGVAGGWVLYHENVHFFTKRHIRKSKVVLKKYMP